MPPVTLATPKRFDGPLPEAVEVAVIGGGIAGIATAWFLARRGVGVAVFEKGRVAGEQSSRNWGWVRQQGRDAAELPIMIEANRIWRALAEETGEGDLAFRETGCLYLAEDAAGARKYEAWMEVARAHQLDTRLLSPAEIRRDFPDLPGDWTLGMLTPSDGSAEPFVAVPALARAAERAGAAIREECAVRALDVAGGRVAGVVTERGRVRAGQVVLAGGAWSGLFAANHGLWLPQLAVRSTVARTGEAPAAYGPCLSRPGFALRRRADGGYTVTTGDVAEHYISPESFRFMGKFLKLLRLSARDVRLLPAAPAGFPMAWGTPRRWQADEASPFERMRVLDPAPSGRVVRRIRERLPRYAPAIAGAEIAEAWAGMIDVMPDAVPVIGAEPALPGLWWATGFSGHGFGIGPAVGRIMADLVTGRAPGHDLTRFRPTRFSDGSPIVPGPY